MNKKRIGAIVLGGAVLAGGALSSMAASSTATSTTRAGRFMQNLTESQKSIMDQARALFEKGDKTAADKLLTDNGIKIPDNKGHKGGKGMHADKSKIDDAIIAGDYATFKTLASTTPLANISQEVFTSLQAPTIAQKQARESIKSILTAAGVSMPAMGEKIENK